MSNSEKGKVEIEITDARVIIPQSVHQPSEGRKRYIGKVASLGEIISVYEDVAEKLVNDNKAVLMSDPGAGSIAETLEKNENDEHERRANLLTGGSEESSEGDKASDGETPDETWTVPELKEYAKANNIDLAGKTTKAEILEAVKA